MVGDNLGQMAEMHLAGKLGHMALLIHLADKLGQIVADKLDQMAANTSCW